MHKPKGQSLFQLLRKGPLRVTVLGSGNWGTAVAQLIAGNATESYLFHDQVTMWVHDEPLQDGSMLSKAINIQHENVKYLPGIRLPDNLVAETNLHTAVEDADLIIFILPHQFMFDICKSLKETVKDSARAISLVKGLHVDVETGLPATFSSVVQSLLGIECCALSGANVAKDVAAHQFSESTIGFQDAEMAPIWQQLFDRPYFRVNAVPDVSGPQVCGAIKNVVALAAGFCDGLQLGSNTKAAIMRIGVEETRLFASIFFDDILEDTFFESCGFADVITTSYGGRNVRCAAEFVRRGQKDSWDQIEKDMLKGMKMQGHLTAAEVYRVVEKFNILSVFPLFHTVYQISFEGLPATKLFEVFQTKPISPIRTRDNCAPSPITAELLAIKKIVEGISH